MEPTTNNRPQLPSLNRMDVEKSQDTYGAGTPKSLPPVTLPSPTYSSGPPPPYSHPTPTSQYTNGWSAAQSGVHTPPESRRTSHEIHDGAKQSSRQSLPSISEALGVDNNGGSFSSTRTSPPSTHQPPSQPLATSPRTIQEPARPEHCESRPPYSNAPTYSYPHYGRKSPVQESARSTYASAQDHPSSLHIQTAQPATRPPAQAAPYSYHSQPTTSTHETPASHPAGSMAPPAAPYGYQPYPPRYSQATPPTSANSNGPIYQPSLVSPSPQTPSSTWNNDNAPARFGPGERPAGYGEHVKRHLDLWDLDAGLNDIAQASNQILEFTRHHGDRRHETIRTGANLSTIPCLSEVDDMISKSQAQMDALLKIRDVVLTQRAAYEQQVEDQRHHHKGYAEHSTPSHLLNTTSDVKADTSIPDTKKRRGRAAPPGRCHSCNRAETPEWRRGPDGARTLCNACGLHYAKLTRKQQGANKAAAAFRSSNLRPKEA
ncbi:Hypothetical protein R9X50_00543200 [Acrodontium crateriforme]|uniref:GATA-type domain-containing protein n=1 Tax=Acrodontium crateriforme TaxID=150365 RepID=A0AAQ3MCK8_9PEZI|nr:Hypothetical protein R9X50_00543200 [Acrodontium crateriforme]